MARKRVIWIPILNESEWDQVINLARAQDVSLSDLTRRVLGLRLGRPPEIKPKRKEIIYLRIIDDEWNRVADQACAQGLSLCDLARRALGLTRTGRKRGRPRKTAQKTEGE